MALRWRNIVPSSFRLSSWGILEVTEYIKILGSDCGYGKRYKGRVREKMMRIDRDIQKRNLKYLHWVMGEE